MIRKILIANRGEIAVRIIRAARELGLKTVAVYSTADKDSMHVKLADEAVCVGPPPAQQSYLFIPNLISAAEITGADAIHPGYGFLAENADFAEICEEHGLTFIGPSPATIRRMGDKAEAKETAKRAGVPVVPGSDGVLRDLNEAMKVARTVGYPVILKAVAGGGGKGMRIVRNEDELRVAFQTAQSEAQAAFGNGDLYLEKYIEKPRHIEVQIMGDKHGNYVHFGERDCSVQRRHQKLIEEAPSPVVDKALRKELGSMAVALAREVEYVGAGTIEFIMDQDRNFYFMEMNTRIQVEHPVTELVTGFDLVKEQIEVAMGRKLSVRQSNISIEGHAIEFRINAENPFMNFTPSPGKIEFLYLPGGPGVRVDTHVYAGYEIPQYYDSLVAKLIVWGENRKEALERARRALKEFIIEGVDTTIPFHLMVLEDEYFISGDISTHFVADRISPRLSQGG